MMFEHHKKEFVESSSLREPTVELRLRPESLDVEGDISGFINAEEAVRRGLLGPATVSAEEVDSAGGAGTTTAGRSYWRQWCQSHRCRWQ